MRINKAVYQNFMSYKHAELNLENRGLILVEGENRDAGGSNGSGKSSLFEGIYWGLYEEILRPKYKPTQVSHNGAGNTCVYLEVPVESGLLRVYRHRDHATYGNKVLAYLGEQDVSMGSNAETQLRINGLLGMDAETFRSVVLYPQGVPGFASYTDAGQKFVLESVLGMGRFANAQERAKLKRKKVQDSIGQVRASIDELLRRHTTKVSERKALEVRSGEFETKKVRDLWTLDNELAALEIKKPTVDAVLVQRLEELSALALTPKFLQAQQLCQRTRVRLQELAVEKARISTFLLALKTELDSNSPVEPSRPTHPSEYYRDDLTRFEKQITACETHISQCELLMRTLGDAITKVMDQQQCSLCKQPLAQNSRTAMMGTKQTEFKEAATRRSQFMQTLAELKQKHETAEDLFYGAQVFEVWENAEQKRQTACDYEKSIARIEESSQTLQEGFASAEDIIKEAESSLSEIENLKKLVETQRVAAYDYEKDISHKLAELEKRRAEVNPYVELVEQAKQVESDLDFQMEKKGMISDSLDEQNEILEYVIEMFGQKGVKSLLLDTVTPQLNLFANEYIEMLAEECEVNFTTLSTLQSGEQRDKFSVEISHKHGGKSYAASSGGEKSRVDIAVLLALGDVAAARASTHVDLRLLDEPFESLDAIGCERVVRLLQEKIAPKVGTVMVMTHSEQLASLFENKITVVKENGVSTIL